MDFEANVGIPPVQVKTLSCQTVLYQQYIRLVIGSHDTQWPITELTAV